MDQQELDTAQVHPSLREQKFDKYAFPQRSAVNQRTGWCEIY